MMIYIQLLKDTNILENDVIVHRKSGEWLEVQRNVAIRLLIEERARVLDYPALLTEYGNVFIMSSYSASENVCKMFKLDGSALIDRDTLICREDNNVYIAKDLITPITILIGLQALQNWHVAIPLLGDLVCNQHDNADNMAMQYTKDIIRDLRVPAYNPNIIFYRNSDHAKRWLDEYSAQLQQVSPSHALIRSLYITKPYHIALPVGSIR